MTESSEPTYPVDRPPRSVVLKTELELGQGPDAYSTEFEAGDYVQCYSPRQVIGRIREITTSGHVRVADVEEMIGDYAGTGGVTCLPCRVGEMISAKKYDVRSMILRTGKVTDLPDDLKLPSERRAAKEAGRGAGRNHSECSTCHHGYCRSHHGQLDSDYGDWEFFCRCSCSVCVGSGLGSNVSWGCCHCRDMIPGSCTCPLCEGGPVQSQAFNYHPNALQKRLRGQ